MGWDEPLPGDLKPHWEAWLRDLPNLSSLKIPRCYAPSTTKDVQQYELHHFSDTSVSGYDVCSYLRTVSKSGEVPCALVMGKARVTPTKLTTIPILELTAAVIATKTSDLLGRELEMDGIREYYWTDSRIVLGYINNEARRFLVFVSNRIKQIRSSSKPSQWRYVASETKTRLTTPLADSLQRISLNHTGSQGRFSYGKENFLILKLRWEKLIMETQSSKEHKCS